MSRARIGIFAGSFDPIHEGHIATALSCSEELSLNILYFMVEPIPWTIKTPIGVEHRRNMVEIGISDFPQLGQIDLEDDQFSIKKTLGKLEDNFVDSELYFILGADVFMKMSRQSWPGLEKLLDHYIVVIERKEITESHITEHAKKLGIVTAILPSQHLEHSSTDVRLQPHKRSLWVPAKIAQYIDDNNLYV